MCKCNPAVKTPYCGKIGCEWPSPVEVDTGEVTEGKYRKEELLNRLAYAERLLSQWAQINEAPNGLKMETEGFLLRR